MAVSEELELRTTPSVVNKRMKELEESLEFSLLNRECAPTMKK